MLASYEFQNNDTSQNPVYQRVVSYINENYRHEITLEELAGEVCMNRSALCRRFKSIAGKTIFEFLNEFRIAYACKLIVNTDALISTIAFDCGFNNISHFNALFKSITHYTPKAYREVFSR
jgi:AraC-like DNA-binding protein